MESDTENDLNTKTVKFAGFMLLFFTVVSTLYFVAIERNTIVSGNLNEIVAYIQANELLFRLGIIHDIVIFISGLLLSFLLYKIVRPVNTELALLALFVILIESVISIVIEFSSLIALLLIGGKEYLEVFESDQLRAFLGLSLDLRASAYHFVTLFYGMGFGLFFFLFYRSTYLNRALVTWGMVSYFLLMCGEGMKISLPASSNFQESINLAIGVFAGSAMLFQLTIGLLFLIKSFKHIDYYKRVGRSSGR